MKAKLSFSTYFAAWAPPVLWAAFIFILSSQSTLASLSVSVWDFIFKKSAHIFVYAVLFWLTDRALATTQNKSAYQKSWWLPLLICVLYAASDEIHQSFVPGRYATFRDIGYDLIGASITFLQKYRYV